MSERSKAWKKHCEWVKMRKSLENSRNTWQGHNTMLLSSLFDGLDYS